MTLITLTDRSFATILAALRIAEHIQAAHSGFIPGGGPFGERKLEDMGHFEPGCPPLTAPEIGELCESLNFSSVIIVPTESMGQPGAPTLAVKAVEKLLRDLEGK